MKIYLITRRETVGRIIPDLGKLGKVVVFDSGDKKISNYSHLFEDEEEKVLGIDPGILEWSFPKEDLERMKNLKGICTKSSWAFYIDIEYCNKHGIPVTNVPGANSQSVAEYAFWMLLSLVKKLPMQIKEGYKAMHDKEHEQIEVTGRKMGIIGLGKVGGHLARMGSAFGMGVSYWSRNKKDVPYEFASVEKILKTSDFIFNSLENCKETQNFLSKEKLALMRTDAYFVSVMGGAGWGVEDDEYLVDMVNTGKLAGFAVENEHKGEFAKEFSGNVFIPGAFAWFTKEAKERTLRGFKESLIGLATGKVVNQVK